MLRSLLYRPHLLKFTTAVFLAAQMLGWIAYAQTGENAAPPATPPTPLPPNSLPAVQRSLREFDRFLDHHPLLEDRLRVEPALTTNRTFLEKTPELREFLAANPKIVEGLKIYPRYFLTRALLRQANAPLAFAELTPLRDSFLAQPKLEQALTANPALIRDPAFLDSHTALRDVLTQHPALGRVFLPSPDRAHSK